MVIAASVSDLRIANMALSNLGAGQIDSLTERSSEAIQCNLWYEFSLLQALESFDWNFARRRVELTTHGDAIPTNGTDPWSGVWAFRYVYPPDCVAFRKLQAPASPPDDAIPFDVETSINGKEKTILTNLSEAVGVYTYMNKFADMYSPYFVTTLSHFIASNIALSLTGSVDIKNFHAQIATNMGRFASASSANEGMEPPPRDADFIRGRA